MLSEEIRRRFLEFFKKRGHTIIPSASLVPEHDPSVLFTTAGMHPLVPYLLGEKHPGGERLANVQKSVRTTDIESIGDSTHLTFFEMLGNWSLGDYFKEDAIRWSYEFLTSKDEGLGLDPGQLYISCFEGDENAPKDTESAEIWESFGIPKGRIYFLGAKDNWWSPGPNGPSGPDTEMFYDLTGKMGDLSKEEFVKATDGQKIVEVWNDVFMEYEKVEGKVVGKLKQKNVDTGAGLERLAMVMQKKDNIFDTDLFAPVIEEINKSTTLNDLVGKRIVADHIRTAVFMIADGVEPSNTDRGYVLRRLLRRAKYYYTSLGAKDKALGFLAYKVLPIYEKTDYGLEKKISKIDEVITQEEGKFYATLLFGRKLIEKIIKNKKHLSGDDIFLLYSTYGYPYELILEIAKENNVEIKESEFQEKKKAHQELSRASAEQKFKGGLADHSEMSVKYHTATHLLHQALREVLGNQVFQRGSNITPERLRFDFSFERKMTDEEKKKVENLVNQKIKEALPVTYEDILLEDAQKLGAIGLFEEKYGDKVRVYKIGPSTGSTSSPQEGSGQAFSLEFCGGPHAKNTSELGHFKIVKEEAVSQGVRRIKAMLE